MNKNLFLSISDTKQHFQNVLCKKLNLVKVPAPLFINCDENLNDLLNGVEKPVNFEIYSLKRKVEIVHSLAKWKRVALSKYNFKANEGIVTDMIAIRRNEVTDNIHSILVDQWDWEVVITKQLRKRDTLIKFAQSIYSCVVETQNYINKKYKIKNNIDLPKKLFVIDSQELEEMFPNIDAKLREDKIAKKYKAVFVTSIGHKLKSGKQHDLRSPEYDDWNLNGDILVWSEKLKKSIELSSMGIRVDEKSLKTQLEIKNIKPNTQYHMDILNKKLPLTIGGGIGQSRIAMFILNKSHIGEVQVSEWSDNEIKKNKFIL